ncbi:MAG: phage Gp37/Gp68 family protein [Gemmatimonadetes bacterium]|nr:phage Gp37/Gp68 family protein [Gemmatimonadota bacterium]
MSAKTGIQWTDATWNPVTGCTKVSAGCDHCYAATLAHRLLTVHYLRRHPIVDTSQNRKDPFAVRIWPERLADPFKWSSPRMIFVNSMSDLFHHDIPDAFLAQVFEVMLSAKQHTYQVLTKRPNHVLRFWKRHPELFNHQPMPSHIWIGTSIEDQRTVYRVAHLVRVPAHVRFLSCEPLLGPLRLQLQGVHWVIVGGESGIVHRPMDLRWARDIRDQCVSQNVPFFFKQVGGRTPKAHGRLLDDRTWDQYPTATSSPSTKHRRARAVTAQPA